MKTKKIYSLIVLFSMGTIASAQMGINTANPQVTLDIIGNAASTSSKDGVSAPLITRQQLAAKIAGTYAAAQIGAMVYVTSATTPTGTVPSLAQTVEITSAGYYFFNGTIWKNVNDESVNLYNSNGTLADNRVVTQGANTLGFNTNAVTGFSVNGTGISVDGSSSPYKVGIGTATPVTILSAVNSVPGNTLDVLSAGINNCGAACGQGTARNLTLFNFNGTNSQFAGIHFIAANSITGLSGAAIVGIDRDATNGYAGLQFQTRNETNFAARMTIRSSGNVGIGTAAPTTALHVVSTADPLRLEGLQPSSGATSALTVNSSGVVQMRNATSISAVRATGNIIITANNINTNTGAAKETFDNLSEFTGNTFTAAATGIYKVNFSINYPQRAATEDGADGYLGFVKIALNGVDYSSMNTKVTLAESVGGVSSVTCINSALVKMTAGNTLTFQGLTYGSTPTATASITAPFTINIVRVD
ncbi:hypothetical protein J3D55_002866 [Chryseobacterium ginsenosidimutans]|uniref:hypothetical protein n=1 Tax=Chryseobacterium ginsenosidimutans TaxID=687846 RepID=UPI0021679CB4|nr:hypothetical protein [Chryseobacterium ginsenosidimutans]MCS3869950.1 hypothetical protein [Chryseobacterium ginsenosidimutans]